MSERDELVARMRDIVQACRHDPFSIGLHTALHSLAQRAADAIERDGARIAELERGEILADKELMSAIITAVMSSVQSDRDDALRKVQRHIIRVEQERDEREAECEHTSEHRALAERRIVELEAEVARLTAENDWLRAYTGQSAKACIYCGLGADEQGKCNRGFPGCARADDQMLCREVEVAMERDELRAENERLKIEAARHETEMGEVIDERDEMESALSAAHVALGGDGEWACRVPSPPPPDSGNLSLDVPVLAAQVLARVEAAERDLMDSAMLLRRVSRLLAKADPSALAPRNAMDWLTRRPWFKASPLRDDAAMEGGK